MIFPYTETPDLAGATARPLLDVAVAGMEEATYPCLVDSGAVNTLLPSWLVAATGLTVDRTDERHLAVAGATTTASFITTRLKVAEVTWEAPVGFCDPWPHAWGILGHDAFFRYFTVTFRAADFEFELEPIGS